MSSAVRPGSTVRVTVQHDKGTALVGSRGWWQAFTVHGLRSATGGEILGGSSFRLTFGGAVPANAALRHCFDTGFSGTGVLRDSWADVAATAWAAVPGRGEYANLLQRNMAPIVVA